MHRPEVEHVVAHLRGEESLPAYAARHQLDVEQLRLWKELYLAGGESAFARRPSRRRGYAVMGAVLVAALVPLSALAVGTCAQDATLWPLSTFCADEPATASEMNDNLRKLVNIITSRTGAADGGADIRQANGAQLVPADGNLRIRSGQPFANVLLNTSANVGGTALTTDASDKLFVNWGDSFSGGVEVQSRLDVKGDLDAAGRIVISGGGDGRGLELATSNATGVALAGYQGDRLVLNYANGFSGGTQLNGNLQVDGHLTVLNNNDCTEVWGGYQAENVYSQANCGDGYFMKGLRCRHTTTQGVECAAYCCR